MSKSCCMPSSSRVTGRGSRVESPEFHFPHIHTGRKKKMKAVITGSGGLIGSECVRVLSREGWSVVGIDNDMRAQFFGYQGTTRPVVEELIATLPRYRHHDLDIRDRQGVRDLLQRERPDFIIHTAAQPSHD